MNLILSTGGAAFASRVFCCAQHWVQDYNHSPRFALEEGQYPNPALWVLGSVESAFMRKESMILPDSTWKSGVKSTRRIRIYVARQTATQPVESPAAANGFFSTAEDTVRTVESARIGETAEIRRPISVSVSGGTR